MFLTSDVLKIKIIVFILHTVQCILFVLQMHKNKNDIIYNIRNSAENSKSNTVTKTCSIAEFSEWYVYKI